MDSRKRRDGAAIEQLGWYNPIDADHSFELKHERIMHWLKEGALPTNAAHKLLRRSGIAHQWHLLKQGLDQSVIDKEMKKWSLNNKEVLKFRAEREKVKDEKKQKIAKSDEVKEDAKSDEVKEDAKSDEVKEDAKSDEVKEGAKSEEVKEDAKSEEVKEDAKSDEVKEDAKSDEVKEDAKSEEVKEDSDKNISDSEDAIPDSVKSEEE